MSMDINVRSVERVSLYPNRQALALGEADFGLWRIAHREWSRPLASKIRSRTLVRIATTKDAIPHEDGTYPEDGTVWISGWTANAGEEPGMPAEQIRQLVRNTHAYLTHVPGSVTGFLSLQHIDAVDWMREAVRAGPKYKLRLSLQMAKESEKWGSIQQHSDRAHAFTLRHPVFFNIPSVDFVRR